MRMGSLRAGRARAVCAVNRARCRLREINALSDNPTRHVNPLLGCKIWVPGSSWRSFRPQMRFFTCVLVKRFFCELLLAKRSYGGGFFARSLEVRSVWSQLC